MKRLFLVCSLLSISFAPVMAQSSSAKTEASAPQDAKVTFRVKINELRNSKTADEAMKTYMSLAEMMHNAMSVNTDKLNKAKTAEEKEKIERSLHQQQSIYRDTKMLTREISKNQGEMARMLEGFLQTM